MQRWDDGVLHDWRRPLAFAADDYEDEEDEDIFNEDGIAEPEEEPVEEAGGGTAEASGDMKRPLAAAILFAICGLMTPVLLILAMKRLGGLSWPPMMMLVFSMMGALAAIGNLVYTLTKGKQYAIPFSLRTFFRWHELAAICALLVPLALINLAAIPEGTHFILRRGEPAYSMIAMIKALPHALRGELAKAPLLPPVPPEATTGLFLGGALWGALGYAMALGLAGMLFTVFRRMNTPFGPKFEERLNDGSGEIEQLVTESTTLFKVLDIPYRMLIGYSAGATVGL
ncbi:MAG: hypothetical protein H7338_11780, partial [Candidatus Sericytochromatia bacterium]|nr:hypothetical protein [Candidatus Sericytochromatia bacterium]